MSRPKSEILRDWINNKLENNYDYSSKVGRTRDFAEFVDAHKDEFDIKADKPLYHAILRKEITRKGIDPRSFGLTPQRPHFPKNDMSATIMPVPQPVPERITYTNEDESESEDVKQLIPIQEQIQLTVDSVGLTLKFMFNFLKLKYPQMNGLTKEEQETLGQVWLPIFRKYLENNWAIWGIAIFCTLSILSTKVKEAKKKIKQENSELENK